MSDEEKFFILLRSAFLEIRMYAYEGENKKSGKIADLFHSMPIEALSSVRSGNEVNYTILLKNINKMAKHRGLQKWVTSKILENSEKS